MNKARMTKTPIVLVAFGTILPKARKAYDYIEYHVCLRHPDNPLYWGLTASSIREALHANSPQQLLQQLKEQGHERVVLQSLHIMPGQEFNRLNDLDHLGMEVAIGKPLLSSDQDIEEVAKALEAFIQPDVPNVLIAHGNETFPAYNEPYLKLEKQLRKSYDNVFVASIEGNPGVDAFPEVKKQLQAAESVHFIPLLLTAGNHLQQDVLGQRPDSWKNLLDNPITTCSPPLGKNDLALNVFCRHLQEALEKVHEQKPANAGA